MTENPDRLSTYLRAVASSLDDRAREVTAEEAIAGTPPDRHRSRQRRALAAVAIVMAAVTGLVAWSALDGGDDETTVVTPGPDRDEQATTITETTAGSDIDWAAMPLMGVAVQHIDGEAELYGFDGKALGTVPAPLDAANSPRLVFAPDGRLEGPPASAVEVPEGCVSAETAGGLRVALCGGADGLPRQVVGVDSAGVAEILMDAPPTDGAAEAAGHWRWATPSPDGRWVLAQWSGECEVPQAFLIDAATGGFRTVTGETGLDWSTAPTSDGLGWAPDGRAVISLREGACGTGAAEPGTYLLDPVTGALELIVPSDAMSDQVFLWIKRAYGSELEWLVSGALRDLGLEGCCGEPSHGGRGVTAGAVFEGDDIGINGYPRDEPSRLPTPTSTQRVPLLHGEAAVMSFADASRFGAPTIVTFICGEVQWWLNWPEADTAEVDSMLLLAEDLVPHLGCTLREPL